MFAVAKSQTQFLDALEAKKSVIWHSGMQLLFCFGKQFYTELAGVYLDTVWREHYPGFSLAYPRALPQKDRKAPLGFQTSGFEYIVQKTEWLNSQDAQGNIAAATLIDEIELWLKAEGSPNMEQHLANEALSDARDFLFAECISIPSTVWQQALPKVHH